MSDSNYATPINIPNDVAAIVPLDCSVQNQIAVNIASPTALQIVIARLAFQPVWSIISIQPVGKDAAADCIRPRIPKSDLSRIERCSSISSSRKSTDYSNADVSYPSGVSIFENIVFTTGTEKSCAIGFGALIFPSQKRSAIG
jgi:hypothetical protein